MADVATDVNKCCQEKAYPAAFHALRQVNDYGTQCEICTFPFPSGHIAEGMCLIHAVLQNNSILDDLVVFVLERASTDTINCQISKKGTAPIHLAVKNNLERFVKATPPLLLSPLFLLPFGCPHITN